MDTKFNKVNDYIQTFFNGDGSLNPGKETDFTNIPDLYLFIFIYYKYLKSTYDKLTKEDEKKLEEHFLKFIELTNIVDYTNYYLIYILMKVLVLNLRKFIFSLHKKRQNCLCQEKKIKGANDASGVSCNIIVDAQNTYGKNTYGTNRFLTYKKSTEDLAVYLAPAEDGSKKLKEIYFYEIKIRHL